MVTLIKPKELSEVLDISLKTSYLKLQNIDTLKFCEIIKIKKFYGLSFDEVFKLIENSKRDITSNK